MAQSLKTASQYLPLITAQAAAAPLSSPALRMAEEGEVTVVYAPFDHIALNAKLVVVGITPGMTQAANALRAAISSHGQSIEQRLKAAKQTASFSGGAIRSNLIAMLDGIGVGRHFGISSSTELFRPGSEDVHFTSALRYPVFVKGQNYNGTPNMIRTPVLRNMIETHLAEEAGHCQMPFGCLLAQKRSKPSFTWPAWDNLVETASSRECRIRAAQMQNAWRCFWEERPLPLHRAKPTRPS